MSRLAVFAGLILVVIACFVVAGSLPVDASPVSEDTSKWEYKAVSFELEEEDYTNRKHTDQLNVLANDGWEYAGLIIPPNYSKDRYKPKSVDAFRRLK